MFASIGDRGKWFPQINDCLRNQCIFYYLRKVVSMLLPEKNGATLLPEKNDATILSEKNGITLLPEKNGVILLSKKKWCYITSRKNVNTKSAYIITRKKMLMQNENVSTLLLGKMLIQNKNGAYNTIMKMLIQTRKMVPILIQNENGA